MPTTNQQAPGTTAEYESEHERLLAEKSGRVLCSIKPMMEEDARQFVIATNTLDGVSAEVSEHFAEELRRLKE